MQYLCINNEYVLFSDLLVFFTIECLHNYVAIKFFEVRTQCFLYLMSILPYCSTTLSSVDFEHYLTFCVMIRSKHMLS